jgi:hypothetical protein
MARSRPAQRSPVNLNDLVRATADTAGLHCAATASSWCLKLAEPLPAVSADADQIGQIVLNLLVNAQQALARNGAPDPRLQWSGGQTAEHRERSASGCAWPTAAPACRRRRAPACSSPSSPPRPRAWAPGSAWPCRARWRATMAATWCSRTPRRRRQPASGSACRSATSRPTATPTPGPAGPPKDAAHRGACWWSTTKPRSPTWCAPCSRPATRWRWPSRAPWRWRLLARRASTPSSATCACPTWTARAVARGAGAQPGSSRAACSSSPATP